MKIDFDKFLPLLEDLILTSNLPSSQKMEYMRKFKSLAEPDAAAKATAADFWQQMERQDITGNTGSSGRLFKRDRWQDVGENDNGFNADKSAKLGEPGMGKLIKRGSNWKPLKSEDSNGWE